MKENYKTQEKIYDAEVLESSTFDENIIIKILIKAGRTIAKPALEVLEMALDPYTPAHVRVSLMLFAQLVGNIPCYNSYVLQLQLKFSFI